MILPPLVIDVHVRERGSRSFRIWFPFVVLWPLLFILVGFALVVSLVVDLALLLAGSRYRHYTRLLLGAMHVLADLRGTQVRVDSATTFVNLDIY
ncbi:MAG TPA: hypothetical protein VGK50_06995 [Coriobacteriia bacterium]|jgi:hypothetical protein